MILDFEMRESCDFRFREAAQNQPGGPNKLAARVSLSTNDSSSFFVALCSVFGLQIGSQSVVSL